MTIIAPSILSADFANLKNELDDIKSAGAEWIHVDIMDGHFVPNLSLGFPVLESIRPVSDLFFDVHLMIEQPIRYIERFCESGADLISLHIESDTVENNLKAIEIIKQHGIKCGVVIKPKTPLDALEVFLNKVDLILIMTVEPGFGAQKFFYDQLDRIRQIRERLNQINPTCYLEVDGGINPETAKLAIAAGANVLVSGSNVFKASCRAAAIKALRE